MFGRNVVLLAIVITLSACSQKYYYLRGLKKAQNPLPSAVSDSLTIVTLDNKSLIWQTINGRQYVLAATWKADTTFYTKKENYNSSTGYYNYNTGKYPIWVTMAPQLQQKNLGRLSERKLENRLQQLLGLPPTANYSYILEIWVSPEDIFRPCFDSSIGKNSCEFIPSKEDAARTDYICWLYKYIYNSYSNPDQMKNYPFTHLGYTYDWNHKNKTHRGLSEFVIGNEKNILIKKVYINKEYFQR